MASKDSVVYLGYLDESVTQKNQNYLNYNTSKVGGSPNWCCGENENPYCSMCKRKMLLVVQLYAPLENSPYHRTLYIFACISPSCWNKSYSWVCLRSQVLDKSATVPTPKTTSRPNNINNEVWLMEDEDWSFTGKKDDGNGNVRCKNNTNLNEMKPAKKNTKATTVKEVTNCLENQMNLNEVSDSNANEAMLGAVGGSVIMAEATAVIDGSDSNVIVETPPTTPQTDIPALLKEVRSISPGADVWFRSYFVSAAVEPTIDDSFSSHEKDLYAHYTNNVAPHFKEEEMTTCVGGEEGGDSVYEQCAMRGDTTLLKFKKIIMRSPTQIIRYCREESSFPLWLRPLSPTVMKRPPPCPSCGGPTGFEMQIMPQLLSALYLEGSGSTTSGSVLEFGTVAVFSCVASCWPAESPAVPAAAALPPPRYEVMLVQAEE